MKTPMELALARIELMKDISPHSIHWQMFKDNYLSGWIVGNIKYEPK